MVQKVPAEFKPECALSKDSITTYDTDHPENHPGFDQCVLEETHLSPLDPGTMQMIDDIDPTSLGDADGDGYLEVSAEVMAEVQELDGSGKTYQLAPFFSDAEEKEPVLMEKIKAVGEVALDVAQWFLPITFGKLSDEKRLDGLPEGLKDATRFHHFEAARDYFSNKLEGLMRRGRFLDIRDDLARHLSASAMHSGINLDDDVRLNDETGLSVHKSGRLRFDCGMYTQLAHSDLQDVPGLTFTYVALENGDGNTFSRHPFFREAAQTLLPECKGSDDACLGVAEMASSAIFACSLDEGCDVQDIQCDAVSVRDKYRSKVIPPYWNLSESYKRSSIKKGEKPDSSKVGDWVDRRGFTWIRKPWEYQGEIVKCYVDDLNVVHDRVSRDSSFVFMSPGLPVKYTPNQYEDDYDVLRGLEEAYAIYVPPSLSGKAIELNEVKAIAYGDDEVPDPPSAPTNDGDGNHVVLLISHGNRHLLVDNYRVTGFVEDNPLDEIRFMYDGEYQNFSYSDAIDGEYEEF